MRKRHIIMFGTALGLFALFSFLAVIAIDGTISYLFVFLPPLIAFKLFIILCLIFKKLVTFKIIFLFLISVGTFLFSYILMLLSMIIIFGSVYIEIGLLIVVLMISLAFKIWIGQFAVLLGLIALLKIVYWLLENYDFRKKEVDADEND